MKITNALLLLAIAALTQSCLFSKDKEEAPRLPPATQTGANTFGCLINGEVWVPKGRIGITRNLTKSYDFGNFNVTAYRTIGENRQHTGIFIADNLIQPGQYKLNDSERQSAVFIGKGCSYLQDSLSHRDGTLTITKLDLTNGIISGTFEFTLAKPDCDTIRATEGRFDLKLE